MKSKLAERLKQLRARDNISQAKLAEQINVSLSFIAEIEMNRSSVSIELLITLAEFFNVTSDYLIGLETRT